MKSANLYFHSPCFDGIVSAVVISDFFRARRGTDEIALHGVNYHLRHEWLTTPLKEQSIVVDFLYHPDAEFWADHHPTTFLTSQMQKHFERRSHEMHVFDASAKSCASLLSHHLRSVLDYYNHRYSELIWWADKTDSADYDSPQEAIFGDAPALQIAHSLGTRSDESYCRELVGLLSKKTPNEVAAIPSIRKQYDLSVHQTLKGLKRFEEIDEQYGPRIRLSEDQIAIFDVDGRGVQINRYAPFYFFPKARYSIGIVRLEESAKITAMRNPWMQFSSVPLGTVFEEVGGGGHERVGSVLLPRDKVHGAVDLRHAIVERIRNVEHKPHGARGP